MRQTPPGFRRGLSSPFGYPASSRTLDMGSLPLSGLDCSGGPVLYAEPWLRDTAKPGIFSGGVASMTGTSCSRFFHTIRRLESRATFRRRKSGLHRIDHDHHAPICTRHRAEGRPGSNCGDRNPSIWLQNSAPDSTHRQHGIVTEIFCDGNGTVSAKHPDFAAVSVAALFRR